jgi:hypothetical protein
MVSGRQRKRVDLTKRLRETRPDGRQRCWVFQCPDPPGNASGNGLGRFCRKHLEHYRRHGDPLKPSYKAAQIAPYRKKAKRWIKANAKDRFVLQALRRIETICQAAGPVIAATNLHGLDASQRARAVWARLRQREADPADIAATIVGLFMCHESDPQKGKREYRQVQIGKALNRMGGGTVKRWPTHYTDPALPKKKVLRWFPASEGKVLRELGKKAEEATEFLVQYVMDERTKEDEA